MSLSLLERLNALSDERAVKFLQYFNQSLLDGVEGDIEEVLNATQPSIQALPSFSQIERLSFEGDQIVLDFSTSVVIARQMLEVLAQDPTFSPLLEKALDTYADREASVEIILAIGLAASMIILTATTKSVKIKAFGGEFVWVKTEASPALVEAIMKALVKIIPSINDG